MAEKMIWYEMKKRAPSSNIFYGDKSLQAMDWDPLIEELGALSEEPEEVDVNQASTSYEAESVEYSTIEEE